MDHVGPFIAGQELGGIEVRTQHTAPKLAGSGALDHPDSDVAQLALRRRPRRLSR
jgi:hypothetical protein